MIVGVAIKKEHLVFCLPEPFRHHHVIAMMVNIYPEFHPFKPFKEQGFITDDWKYLDRKTAAKYALENGQCTELISPPNLFSEDLW